jgi:ribosomal peptide maturation radical SAM protein 1
MLNVSLINMPFAPLEYPVLGLTQLKTVMDSKFQGRVAAREAQYLNLDFAHFMGIDFYQFMCRSGGSTVSGYGDWFFRQAAFPEQPENSEIYFRRYFPVLTDELKKIKNLMLEKRQGLNTYLDELITKYRLDIADVVGFTSMFAQNAACFAMARRLKRRNPEVLIVMGGSNCESPMGQEIIKHVAQVDYVFSGPALKSFPAFLEAVLGGERKRCEQIRGVFTRDNVAHPPSIIGEEVDINESTALDYAPFLRTMRSNFPNREIKPILVFETSRGCWWGEKAHCTFCGLNGLTMNYRSMRPEKAIEQITSLFKYSTDSSHFMCIDNIMPTNYPVEVFPHLKTPPGISIFYEVKADLTADEMQALSGARVKLIQPGIEALSTATLKLMKKGTTVFQNLAFLKNCLLYDLYPVWNLLVGFPGEDEEVYKKYLEDLPLLVHLPAPNQTSRVLFDRYSPYHSQSEQYGLDLRPCDFYTLIYPFDKECLSNLAYHFVDHNFAAPYFGYMIKWLGQLEELVAQWQRRWEVEAALQPKLYVKEQGNGSVAHDTRSGELVEHQLSQTHLLMLAQLHKPKRLAQLARDLPEVEATRLSDEMQWFKQRGLVFQEGDRFLALVLPNDSPRFTITLNIQEQEFSEVG